MSEDAPHASTRCTGSDDWGGDGGNDYLVLDTPVLRVACVRHAGIEGYFGVRLDDAGTCADVAKQTDFAVFPR